MPKRKSTSSSSNSSKKSTPTSLNEQLQADGYRIIHVPRLGNCLFAAIETQFQGYTIAALRARAVEYMREHPNEFATLAGDGDTFTAYLARMSRDRTWGGDAEAQALASSLLINIHIYDNNGPTRVMVPHNGIATRDIRILHDHYHFDAIVPTNFKSLNNYYNSSSVIDLEVPQENPLPEKKYITSGFKELENDLKELEASGYKMRWVEGDGNCLFRSVAEQLKDFNQNDHGILRKKTATYLKDHREDFSGQHRHTDIEEAISYVSKLTNYAGNFEFQILADYLGVDIQVHEKYGYFIASRTKTITKTDTIDIHVYFFRASFLGSFTTRI